MKIAHATVVFAFRCTFISAALLSSALLSSSLSEAQDLSPVEMVITPNLVNTPERRVASSVTVVTAQEIENRGVHSVLEVLRDVPGVDIVRSGGAGGNTVVFLRGNNSEHTLILIDGTEANNPMSTNRAYNLADLSVDTIEKIEILRGPQSTLYGSDAIGGVINIITKKGTDKPYSSVKLEAGSLDTFNEAATLRGAEGFLNYSLSATRQDTGGISAADSRLENSERDRYGNTSFSGRLGFTPSENLDGALYLRFLNARADLDNNGGTREDDPNRVLTNEEIFIRTETSLHLLNGDLTGTFYTGYSNHELHDDNDPDTFHPLEKLRSNYQGDLFKFGLLTSYKINDAISELIGVENEHERGSSGYNYDGEFGPFISNFDDRASQTTGLFSNTQLAFSEDLFAALGVRLDDHSKFGQEATWRIAPTYNVPCTNTKIFTTLGTGYKAPSLYQLYSSYGRTDLSPEKSLGLDVGFEQRFYNDKIKLGVTYFWNKVRNLISFNPDTFILENIARTKSSGIETTFSYRVSEEITTDASVTYTDTRDLDTELSLLRRPSIKSAFEVSYSPEGKRISAGILAVGKRADNDFSTYPATRTSLAGSATIHVTGSLALSKSVELFARVENLLDKNYQEVLGYGTPGVAAFGGIKVSL